MEGALLAPVLLDPFNHLIALFPQPVHLHQLLRRVLQIAVHHRAAVAPGLLQPGEHGRLLAEVPAEMEAHHMFVLLGRLPDHVPGLILGAVVHEQQLIVDAGLLQNGAHPLGGGKDHFFLIV